MKLSIITINRNNAKGLRRTLESTFVAQPGFDDWEQIVVDGASTDGSFAVLDKWKDDPHLGWHVSEPDTGIYNAMNKGAAHARGDYLLFLNSGDELLPDVLEKTFAGNPAEDILCGDAESVDTNGNRRHYPAPDENDFRPEFFLYFPIHHQACFIARSLHVALQGYDESLHICADGKFFFAAAVRHASFKRLPFVVDQFDLSGISSQPASWNTRLRERESFLVPHFGASVVDAAMRGRTNAAMVHPALTKKARQEPAFLQRTAQYLNAYWSLSQTGKGRLALRMVLFIMERRWRKLFVFRITHRPLSTIFGKLANNSKQH